MKPLATALITGSACATLLVVAVPAAQAEIKPGRSIDGVHIGQSHTTVLRHQGEPRSVTTRRIGMIQQNVKVWKYGRNGRRLTVTFLDGDVVQVTTGSKSQRTANGVGVGSTKSEVRAGFVGPCQRVRKRVQSCGYRYPDPGERTTWLQLLDGVVYKVGVKVGLY